MARGPEDKGVEVDIEVAGAEALDGAPSDVAPDAGADPVPQVA